MLLARRLIEKSVRFIQAYNAGWDSHDFINGPMDQHQEHRQAHRRTDPRPQATRLDETLVIWCGEFGRSPDNGVRDGGYYGRDHNSRAMTMWFAGGGVNTHL